MNIKSFLKSNSFTLFLSTALGQGISIALTPFVSNIFGPEAVGLYQINLSASLIFAAFLSLKIEYAALKEDDQEEQSFLLKTAFKISVLLSTTIVIVSVLLLLPLRKHNWLSTILLGLLSGFLLNTINIISNKQILNKTYRKIALLRVIMYGLVSPLSLCFGFVSAIWYSLLAGDVISKALAIFSTWTRSEKSTRPITMLHLIEQVKSKYNYTLFMTANALVNVVGTNIIVFFIAYNFKPDEVGVYGISRRLVFIPILWITDSMSKTYIGGFSALKSRNEQLIYLKKYISKCCLFVPFIAIGCFVIKFAIPYFFSKEWYQLGDILILQIPFFLTSIVVMPIALTLDLLGNSKLKLKWDIIRIAAIILSFLWASTFHIEFKSFILGFSIINAFFFGLFLLLVFKAINAKSISVHTR